MNEAESAPRGQSWSLQVLRREMLDSRRFSSSRDNEVESGGIGGIQSFFDELKWNRAEVVARS